MRVAWRSEKFDAFALGVAGGEKYKRSHDWQILCRMDASHAEHCKLDENERWPRVPDAIQDGYSASKSRFAMRTHRSR